MLRYRLVPALAPIILFLATPLVHAESVWVTDALAHASLFSGAAAPVIKDDVQDTAAKVDILFAQAEATAGAGFASAYSQAQGSQTGALQYTTFATSRADAELNGLTSGRYRVSFSYLVLASGGDVFAGNESAVGYEYEGGKVELKGTDAGSYLAELALDVGGKREDLWIAFFAWTNSHAIEGVGSGNASVSDIVVERLPDQPVLVTPLPAGAVLFAPAILVLGWSSRRTSRA